MERKGVAPLRIVFLMLTVTFAAWVGLFVSVIIGSDFSVYFHAQ